ncbi:MAG TPA: J domain-containing protein [Hyphomicrobiaceae bacterium]|nr:J domain-containing protein [Hyphomicrobiaceae bacterium]
MAAPGMTGMFESPRLPPAPASNWFATMLRTLGIVPPGPLLFIVSGALMALGAMLLVRRRAAASRRDGSTDQPPAHSASPIIEAASTVRGVLLQLPAPQMAVAETVIAAAQELQPRAGERVAAAAASEPVASAPQPQAPATDTEALPTPDGDAGEACRELDATAAALSQIVGQMVADLGSDGELAAVLKEDLQGIDAELAAPKLRADIAAKRWSAARVPLDAIIADLQRIRTLARIESERRIAAMPREPQLPVTRAEACEALGVNPQSDMKAIKKVVDALRLTWHPDLAVDDAERRSREDRMKQINAAWDVLIQESRRLT